MSRTRHSMLVLAVLAALAASAGYALARSSGAPASKSGAPALGGVAAEGLCTDCHGDFGPNNGGSITVLNVPPLFRAGRTYRLTVHLASTQTASISGHVWGFQLTAVDNSNGQGAGTFTLVDAVGTKIVSGSGSFSTRRYVDQTSSGIKTDVASPAEWQVDWTAPASAAAGVTFFAAGLAGDGTGTGGWVYNTSVAAADTTTAVVPTSWGAIKASYR